MNDTEAKPATYILIDGEQNAWCLASGCEIRAIPIAEVEQLADGGLTLSETTNISRSRVKVAESGRLFIEPIEIERSEQTNEANSNQSE